MCIAINSNGHLDILLLYEQNLAERVKNGVQFTECYDLILRNYGRESIDTLYMLSPHRPQNRQHVYQFLDYANTTEFDWIFERSTRSIGDKYTHELSFDSIKHGQRPLKYNTTMLKPKMVAPDWMKSQTGIDREIADLFSLFDMTYGHIKFQENALIKPYDPTREAETTYWIRLCFKPKTQFLIQHNIRFGVSNTNKITVQPCLGLGPNTVVELLFDKLAYTSDSQEELSLGLARHIVKKFTAPKTSTVIEEYRIILITDENFLVLNPYFLGTCSYCGIQRIDNNISKALQKSNKMKGRIIRLWHTGYREFEDTNAILLAKQLYMYIKAYCGDNVKAKTASELSRYLSIENKFNVAQICEGLEKFGFLKVVPKKIGENLYTSAYYLNRQNRNEKLLYSKSFPLQNIHIREIYSNLLDLLYDYHNITTAEKNMRVRFTPKCFNIQYELAYS